MKIKRIISSILFSSLFLLSFCTTEPNEDYISYKIKIDKVTIPDTVSVTDTLSIIFDGTVGGDGCHHFKNFEVLKNLNEINITVWGEKPNFETVCPAVMVYLEGKEYKMVISKSGLYKVIIHQPDNTVFIDSVYVK